MATRKSVVYRLVRKWRRYSLGHVLLLKNQSAFMLRPATLAATLAATSFSEGQLTVNLSWVRLGIDVDIHVSFVIF